VVLLELASIVALVVFRALGDGSISRDVRSAGVSDDTSVGHEQPGLVDVTTVATEGQFIAGNEVLRRENDIGGSVAGNTESVREGFSGSESPAASTVSLVSDRVNTVGPNLSGIEVGRNILNQVIVVEGDNVFRNFNVSTNVLLNELFLGHASELRVDTSIPANSLVKEFSKFLVTKRSLVTQNEDSSSLSSVVTEVVEVSSLVSVDGIVDVVEDFTSVKEQANSNVIEEGSGALEGLNSGNDGLKVLNGGIAFLDGVRNNLSSFTESNNTSKDGRGGFLGEVVVGLSEEDSDFFRGVNAVLDFGPVFLVTNTDDETVGEVQDVSSIVTRDGDVISPNNGGKHETKIVTIVVPVSSLVVNTGVSQFIVNIDSVDKEVLSSVPDERLGSLVLLDGVPEKDGILFSTLAELNSGGEDLEGLSNGDNTLEDLLVVSSYDFSRTSGDVLSDFRAEVNALSNFRISSLSANTLKNTSKDVRKVLSSDSMDRGVSEDGQSNGFTNVETVVGPVLAVPGIYGVVNIGGDFLMVNEDILSHVIEEGNR